MLGKYTAFGSLVVARAGWPQFTDKPGFKLSFRMDQAKNYFFMLTIRPPPGSAAGSSAVLPSVNPLW